MDTRTGHDQADEDLSHLEDAETAEQGAGPKVSKEYSGPVYRLKIIHSSETHLVVLEDPEAFRTGDMIVVMTRYGRDIGEIVGEVKNPGRVQDEEFLHFERLATKEDMDRRKAFAEREREAFKVCLGRILARNMPMKLVSAHYLMDEPKILFFFTAEARVDFRELVKDLVSQFKTRIELRQIGVRDEARVLGGLGVCGQVFCCHGVTDKLNAVSIKMAKDQNLSLNSMKISGPCGRLLCCLSYESQLYRDERRALPAEGVKIPHEGTVFRVVEINVLKALVRLAGEDGRMLKLPSKRFKRGDDGRWGIVADQGPQVEPQQSAAH
jgi:cell fate regulator YaaT (PSP1 superfamily)